ncbi:hypothetical protein D8674_001077 [Pyrus ussuriensis x Pyrus communis]|uniref:Protein kinase domain-containing protein n=1 Tax=Pyrus ussuriensis x Pyrus communis TaxID=2448454 RepID=A0A5N5F5B6_9ROSA|nr:hypothetical protein D8674_001077 [Pyrus ussuriensis x Pyrus communis]
MDHPDLFRFNCNATGNSNFDSNPKAKMENPTMTLEPRDELLWLWNTKEIRRPDNSLDRKYYWNKIFIVVCLFAILTDPLFLYIPILKDDIKCLMLDRKLKIVVLLLRSLTDLFYLMDIIIRIYRSKNCSNLCFVLKSCLSTIAKATTCVSIDILIDIVALLPLSQVAILIFFSKMSDLRSLTTTRMVLMNIFALLQYVPRVLRIYLLSKELKNKPLKKEITVTPIWIKGVLNFYMYIIASHVVGAMWYFFAIQRMMICWHSACRKDDGCDNRIFGCHDHHFFRNTTILNGLCPVSVSDNSSNTIFFDFGIFATVLQYGVVGSTNYFQKFLNCFWWGLRNLSSFGSNLEPSVNGWENLYSVCITTTGLLLFLYLLGNLQMPKFQNMEESVLKQICSHLRPVKCYRDSGDIIQRGDPIQMFFVVDGHIFDPNDNKKGPGEICGEELLDWPFLTSFPRRVPRAVVSPRADRSPEVLVLTAVHMETIATEFRKHFIKNYGRLAQKLVNHASPAVTMPGPSSSEAVVRFTEEEIKEATSNYSCHNYENEGGYGAVYEAALPGSETPVAIKTSNSADIGNRFIQSQHLVHEAFVLSHIRHKNVVRLLGCCLETQWPIMVYDRTYARTLEEHIRLTGPKLLLQQRMNIAAETAGALAYLHSMSVTHRDVKTANILIDHTTHIAKLSGFGASRWLDDEVSTLAETQWLDDDDSTSPTLPGTTGYLDPEYLESQVLTEKSDVYSFGVVLVELLTSQAAVSSDRPERSLANVFLCSMQKGHLHQILDRKVFKDNFSFEIAEQVSKLAVTCLGPSGEERPSMEEVAAELDRVVKLL